jgi:D-3-phosphoglycerate dehydrogenase
MRVLIADKLAETVPDGLEAAGCAVVVDAGLKDEALRSALLDHDPDVLVVRSTKVRAEHLEAARSLSLIVRAGAGVNTIDVVTASSRGVCVCNCPGKNAVAVAELVFGHLINLDRSISDNVALLRQGGWAKKRFGQARGIHGRTMAVLGTGMIGQAVIRRAHAFGIEVRAWSRSLTPERAAELGVHFAASPLDACRGADVLTIHLAQCDATRGLVGEDLLEALAPGAFVINTSRAGIVDHAALERVIERRGLRAGLDVFPDEPAASDEHYTHPIAQNPAVYGTHHIGASTEQAKEAVGAEVVRVVTTWLREGRAPNCVNLNERSTATHVLVVRHRDQVGVLASVLAELREAGCNIQEMENTIFSGRGAAARARIQLSSPPAPAALARVEALDTVFAATLVALES